MFPSATVDMAYLSETISKNNIISNSTPFHPLDGHFRSIAICLMYVMWGLSEMLIIYPLSFITTDWRYFTIFFIGILKKIAPLLGIPIALGNIVYFYIMETPKYYYSKD